MKTVQKRVSSTGGGVAAALLALGMAVAGQSATAEPVTAGRPDAQSVAAGQAVVTELGGNAKAVTYWSQRPEGAVVVTTVDSVSGADSDTERHAVVRLQSVLQSGQSQEISVPLAIGAEQPVLRIERLADRVTVSRVSQ